MTKENHNKIQKNVCFAVMRANFRNHTNFIRELFKEYVASYPEVTIEEITAMMICETVNEINTSATIAYRYRNERN